MILKYKLLCLIATALNFNGSRCLPEGPTDNNSTPTCLINKNIHRYDEKTMNILKETSVSV